MASCGASAHVSGTAMLCEKIDLYLKRMDERRKKTYKLKIFKSFTLSVNCKKKNLISHFSEMC